jgi:hypothetical protein
LCKNRGGLKKRLKKKWPSRIILLGTVTIEDKLEKIQGYHPKAVTGKILSRRGRIETERKHTTRHVFHLPLIDADLFLKDSNH